MKKESVMIDTKVLYEVCPDIPMRKVSIICKMCNKQMRVWGEVTTFGWMDYFDGNGKDVDLCESCAKIMVKKIEEIISGK